MDREEGEIIEENEEKAMQQQSRTGQQSKDHQHDADNLGKYTSTPIYLSPRPGVVSFEFGLVST